MIVRRGDAATRSKTIKSDTAGSALRRFGRRAGFAILLLAVYVGVSVWQQRGLAAGPAPELAQPLLDGGRFSLDSRRGAPVLVYFWGSWCPVCRLEQGTIESLARDGSVVTVAMQSGSDAELTKWLRERGLVFPVVNDPDGMLAAGWGVRAVPAFFIVDADGAIRFREVGYTSSAGLRLRLWLAGLT